ncbi:O-antigen translocase [Photobacterium sagamiensis]|uniref:O-antigen translocase n=1 Tax=Photobacterium sagamiensis TaxID=2910241 RepID=UPI003D128B0E
MNIFRTSFLSFLATLIKTVSQFLIIKVVAVFGGPAGVASFAMIQNYLAICQTTSGTALQTGVVRFISTAADDKDDRGLKIFSSSLQMSIILWIITSVIFYSFISKNLDELLSSYEVVYYKEFFILSIPFCVINTLYMSYLNGVRRIKDYIMVNIGVSLSTLLVVISLGYLFKIVGILYAVLLFNIIVFLYLTTFSKRFRKCLIYSLWNFRIDFISASNLLKFSIITVTTILVTNISLVMVRNILSNSFSAELAGIWQGVWSLSQVALSFLTLSLSTYLLPALSSAKTDNEIRNELKKAIVIVLPVSIIGALLLFVLRDFIVLLLYTEDFLPIGDMLPWQLFGNVVKSVSWLLGYILVAKAMIKMVVVTELIMGFSLISLTAIISAYGNENAAVIAYFVTSLAHFVMMLFIFIREFSCDKKIRYHHSNPRI